MTEAARPPATLDAEADPTRGPSPAPDGTTPQSAPGTAAHPSGGLIVHTDLLGDLVVPDSAASAAELQDLATRAAEYASRARSAGTRRVYRSAWRGFEA